MLVTALRNGGIIPLSGLIFSARPAVDFRRKNTTSCVAVLASGEIFLQVLLALERNISFAFGDVKLRFSFFY